MPHLHRIAAVSITLLLAAPLLARAELPMPTYPQCGEPDQPELCPPDLGYEWEWSSYIPTAWKDNIRSEEWDLGPGLWADRAWRTTTGRTDVIIAVLDSGVMWDFGEVLRKHYLHAPELPVPQDAAGVDATDHDANGDGVFNISDYADDPRLDPTDGVDPADGILDPSDLIATFSDGVDDDGNGFIDDISGWDFFWNDNDPYDEVRFDHGAWEAQLAVAEGNDGDNDIGVCPNCMLLNVRVGDSFVCDVSNFANGLLYAVDMGADVVIEALGTLNNSTHAIEAIDYAWDHDVTILGSAADECSYHQNYPANNHHTLYTHAIIHDDEDEDQSTTYLNFANNTNYGGRLDLSVGAHGASSAAVGLAGGAAGLIYSRAKDIGLDPPLSAAEVRALMLMTAIDVDVPESWTDPDKYPSKAGWDPHFGYGRLNVHHAVERVADDTIPPEADLLAPDWFQVLDPSSSATVDVVGYAAARRAGSYDYSLQVAVGIHPDDADFAEVASGSGLTAPTDGVLGTIDLTAVPLDPQASLEPYQVEDDDWSRYLAVNQWSVTVRLVVEDDLGNTTLERKVFYLHQDPDLLPGFPFRTVASLESSPVAFDVDGDHRDEVLYITADGLAFLCDVTGEGLTPRAGWPQSLALQDEADPGHPDQHLDQPAWNAGGVSPDAHHSIMGTAAIHDLDDDGVIEIVVASLGGQVIVWHTDGTVADGWPVMLPVDTIPYTAEGFELDYGTFAAPVIEDLDGDGQYEIIIAAMDQHLHVYRADGSSQPGFPVLLRHVNQMGDSEGKRIITTPAVGDMDGDGQLDIVAATNEEPGQSTRYSVVYAVHGDGELHAGGAVQEGWPIYARGAFNGDLLPYIGEGAPACPALGDVDGDGTLELAFFSIGDSGYLYGNDGAEFLSLANMTNDFGHDSNSSEEAFSAVTINSPSFGDLNNDGVLDLAMGSAGWAYAEGMLDVGRHVDRDHLLSVWDGSTGEFLPGFPQVMEDMQFFMNPAIADLDGDGYAEVINGSGGFLVHAFNQDGVEPGGWPKFTGQWLLGSPSIGDFNGDGMLDLVQGTRNGWLFAWTTTTPIAEANVQWATMHHDLRNTRNYHTVLPTYPAVEPPPSDDDGCECAYAEDARPTAALALMALLAVTLLVRTLLGATPGTPRPASCWQSPPGASTRWAPGSWSPRSGRPRAR